jgi:hypothetical protein
VWSGYDWKAITESNICLTERKSTTYEALDVWIREAVQFWNEQHLPEAFLSLMSNSK